MALQHDNEGFLTGPRQDIDPAAYARHIDILREIRGDSADIKGDVAAIRKLLANPVSARSAPSRPASNSAVFNQNQLAEVIKRAYAGARGADGRFVPSKTVAPSPVTPAVTVAPSAPQSQKPSPIGQSVRPVKAGGPRRSNGQFGGDDSKRERRETRESSQALGNAADSLKRSAGELVSGATQVDPTLAAAKEVGDIVSPAFNLFKPMASLFKRKPKEDADEKPLKKAAVVEKSRNPLRNLFSRKPGASAEEKTFKQTVPWYRRLLNELREINKKSGGKSGVGMGGLSGLLGLLSPFKMLTKLPMVAALGRLMMRGRGMAGRGATRLKGLFGKGAKGFGGMLGKGAGLLGGLGKGVLKRIPILGALISGGSALASIFGSDDPNKSAAENRKDRFTGGGAGIGSLIGGAIGMLGGPLGAIAGAAIGDIVGEKVGAWLSTVNWEDVGKSISDGWTATTDWFKDTWSTVSTYFTDSWKKISDLATGAFDAVNDWVSSKVGAVKKAVGGALDTAKDVATNVVNKGSELASKGVNVLKNAATTITGGTYKAGSNTNKAAVIEAMNGAGIKDPKEQAMFMAQMDHESGGFRTTSENLNYSKKGLLKTFGKYYKTDAEAAADANNPEAIANKVYGGRMGNTDPGDGYKFRGRGFTQLTGKDNYIEAGNDLGLDLVNNPDQAADPANAAKISAWYWKKRNIGAAGKAGDVESATRRINGGLNGLADRKEKYSQYLTQASAGELTMQTGNDTKAVPPPAVAQAIASAMSVPKVPPMLAPVSVSAKPVSYTTPAADLTRLAPKDAPSLIKPIGSSDKPAQAPVRIESQLTQNLSDRSIAAVATGGIGMNGTL